MIKNVLIIFFCATATSSLAQTKDLLAELTGLHDAGDYDACIKMESSILEWVGTRTDTAAADAHYYLAMSHLNAGSFEKAISFFEKEKLLREQLLPVGAEDYSNALYNLSYAYLQVNDYENGKRVGRLLLEFDKKNSGLLSEEYLQSLFNYVDILSAAGEVEAAENALEQLIKSAPELSRESGELISKLADVCSYSGKYNKAERLFLDALQLLQVSDGEESEIYNITLSNYASLLIFQAKYDKAVELLSDVMEKSMQHGFANNTYYATLNNFSRAQRFLGQYSAAEHGYKKLIAMDSISIGVNHPDFSITLSNLGLLYIDQGKLKEAEKVLKRSIDILKKNKDVNSISYAKSLNNLAKAYQRFGKYQDAIKLLQQSLLLFERHFGKESPEYATVTFNIGVCYLGLKSPKALASLKAAQDIRGKILGKSHPLYAECEEKLAHYHWLKNNKEETGKLYNSVFNNYFEQINNYFPVLTEEEKSNFFYQKVKPSIETFASFVSSSPSNAQVVGQVYDYHLNTKGLILMATEKVRRAILNSGDTSLIKLHEEWENAKDILTFYYSTHGLPKTIDSLVRRASDLEKALAQRSAIFSREVVKAKSSWRDIQKKLKPGEAAVEFLRYRVYNPDSARFTSSVNYLVMILTSELKDGPVAVHMNSGLDMEKRYLNYYRNGIKLKLDDSYTFKQYWEAIQDQLTKLNVRKVYLSPDGVYNIINVNTIRNPFTEKYLVDELDIRLVTSTRTLLDEAKKEPIKGTGFLFGFPNYNVNDKEEQKRPAAAVAVSRSFRGGMLRFLRDGKGITPLPGTKIEVEQISQSMRKHSEKVEMKIAETALESEIKSMKNPELVHIATHGYFLDDDEEENPVKVPNALLMSGVIMAGAENFIRTGTNPVQENEDGILTAYEAMNLDLTESKLVVLSACETGLGKIYPGEGVYGLQRAFQVAGANAMIMSLWTVDDAATQLLMTLFYDEYLSTNNLHDSFRNAQKKLKEKYPQPFYWGAFILVTKGN